MVAEDILIEIRNDLAEIKAKVTNLERAVLGNGLPSMESRVVRMEVEIQTLNKQKAQSWQVLLALGVSAMTFVGSLVLQVLK